MSERCGVLGNDGENNGKVEYSRKRKTITCTHPDIMIIIRLSNFKKGRIVCAQDDLIYDCSQSLICVHMMYKIPVTTLILDKYWQSSNSSVQAFEFKVSKTTQNAYC
jgi:hypothetical protein